MESEVHMFFVEFVREFAEAVIRYVIALPRRVHELYRGPHSFEGWIFLILATIFWLSCLISEFIAMVIRK